jgi:hypothetical protein
LKDHVDIIDENNIMHFIARRMTKEGYDRNGILGWNTSLILKNK